MIAVGELLEEIGNEAIARGNRGQRLREVRLHPLTFERVVNELNARVDPGAVFTLHTAAGSLRVVSGSDADVVDHLYFKPDATEPGEESAR